jgi:glycosyltransferase involved in cell wall biosynthesis
MKILVTHNHYQQYGGEDVVSLSEVQLLQKNGEEVLFYERNNQEIKNLDILSKLKALAVMPFSQSSYREIRSKIKLFRPDIVHSYNTFFMITPALFQACFDEKVPVVQSLYNYRLVCANALLLRNGKFCDNCLTQPRWKSIVYRCYRKSSVLTAFVNRLINYHWRHNTWTKLVDRYIVATDFSKQIFIKAGIEPSKIVIKPHFLPESPFMNPVSGNYALYVGRISIEKGVEMMVKAWSKVKNFTLKVMGEGPLLQQLKDYVARENIANVELLGFQSPQEYEQLLRQAKVVIVPSINNDNFPRVIVEAYGYGIPVIGSSLSGIQEYIKDKKTGLVFQVGDQDDLVRKINWVIENAQECANMRTSARKEYEDHYTADKNYEMIKQIYRQAIEHKKG